MALGPGSIAFVGLNSDGNDNIAFVALELIPAGTTIYFQDNEWDGAAFNTGESAFRWTAGADVVAGTVVSIDNIGSGTIGATFGTAAFDDASNRGLANSTEVVYAFVGSSATSPTAFLTAIANNTFNSGSIANTGLVAGQTALELAGIDPDADVAAFNGARTGQASFLDYRAAINNAANWITQDASGDQSADGVAPDVPFSTQVFSVAGAGQTVGFADASLTVAEFEGDVGTTAFSFTVERMGGTTGDVSFSGTIATSDAEATDFAGGVFPASFNGMIPDGASSATVTIDVAGDLADEDAESFTLTLTSATNSQAAVAIDAASAVATATILDDDGGTDINGIAILPGADGTLQGALDTPVATNAIDVSRIGGWVSGNGLGGAESLAFDPATDRLFVTSAAMDRVEILDFSNPFAPTKVGAIELGGLAGYGEVNSVAVKNGIVAVAFQNASGGQNGFVHLYDASGALLKEITVGVLPDQLTFSPDGTLLLVANEAERFVDRSSGSPVVVDAAGTISIIDVSGGAANASIRNTVGFEALDGFEAELAALGIDIFDGQANPVGNNQVAVSASSASGDIEPEYIAVSADGTKAYVTLQEVNAVAVIDLTNASADKPVSILPLGYVDHSLAGNEGDFSDRDGPGNSPSISINTSPVKGQLMPDAIASFDIGGKTYFITANEGDSRIMSDPLVNDPDGFNEARASAFQPGVPADYARLNVDTNVSEPGDLQAFGGRGFSIFRQEADGTITKVEESGGEFQKIIGALPNANTVFNGQNGGEFDTRSDNKGPEPEGVDVTTIDGRTYAFITLERAGGIMVYDVTVPESAQFVRYVQPTSEDFGPEVVKIISAADSPTGQVLVVTANELSGSVTVYEAMDDDRLTGIYEIQGSSHISEMVGDVVTTRGVVTAVDTNGSRGFWIQDPNGDGNTATSDGIFVFFPTSAGALPQLGHLVEITGTVGEFTPSGAAVGSFSGTQLSNIIGGIKDLGVGPEIEAVRIGGEGGLVPPTESLIAGGMFYESLEGMKVTVVGATAVGPTNNFGEIFSVVDSDADTSNGLNATGLTDRGTILLTPGAGDFGDTNTSGGDFNPERIQIDDDSGMLPGFATPKVNVGAVLEDVTGILRYDFGNYEVIATEAYGVAEQSTLVKETTVLAGSATRLTVASYNAENLDPKLEDINLVANKSASNVDDDLGAGKFDTIAAQILSALNAPDIVALQEIQDGDGAEITGLTAASLTLQILVDKINALAGPDGPHYAYIDNVFIGNETNGGQPGGNIRNAFLYRDDRVDYVEGSLKTIGADGSAVTSSYLDQQSNPDNPFHDSRPPLAATFLFNGQEVTVVNNHFTSKGGSGPLMGSDQPPLNAGEVQRAAQAQAVNNFVDDLLAADPEAKVIVAGDLNEFPSEEPMQVMKGTAGIDNYDVPGSDPFNAVADYILGGEAVLADLLDLLPEEERYDYVFEGNAQTLDHMLVTEALLDGAQFDVVRLNAEFADQTSDHDPLVASFEIAAPVFTLQLLHMSDQETSLLSVDTAPIMGALIDRFDDQYANTLILAGGDNYLPGPFMTAGADPSLNALVGSTALGRPDIAMHNAMGVEVSAIGNHEWDLGSAIFAGAIAPAGAWSGALFPYVSANLDFSKDSAINPLTTAGGQVASAIKGKIAPSTIVTEGGERIGIVGATTQVLERISSPTGTEVNGFPKAGEPGDNQVEVDDMLLLAQQLQPVIDALRDQGVNKIVLMSHLQSLANEKALAPLLNGVDIILSAGSHTRAGDANDDAAAFPGHDANFVETYPIVTQDAAGNPTLIVVTDSENTYLGRLVVNFDQDGEIILDDLDSTINGAYASTEETLEEAYGDDIDQAFAEGSIGDKVRDITTAVDAVIAAKDGTVYGFSNVYHEGDRVFGRAQETNLGDLSADANAFAAALAVPVDAFIVSLKNGGGIRASIGSVDYFGNKNPTLPNPELGKPVGGISQLDIENALRFDNKLMVFDTTPQGLLNILNFAAGLNPGNGGFPQLGGLRFSYDPDFPVGSRVVNVALYDGDGNQVAKVVENGVVVPGAPSLISIVTLNFTANGGDGYPTKANGENFRYLLTDGTLSAPVSEALDFTAPANVPANALGEQKAFADYLQEFHGTPETAYTQADTPAGQDLRIENLNLREDAVFTDLPPVIEGDFVVVVEEGATTALTVDDLNGIDDGGAANLTYAVSDALNGDILVDGVVATSFSQAELAAGLVGFRHDGSETEQGAFTVTLTDADGLSAAPQVITVAVIPQNDAPVVADVSAAVHENETAVFDLATNGTDAEDGYVTLTGFSVTAVTGIALDPTTAAAAFAIIDGKLSFVPGTLFDDLDTGEAAAVSLSYTVEDEEGAQSTASFTLTVNGETDLNPVQGTDGANNLFGSAEADLIDAKGGNDYAFGRGGDDVMKGGEGADYLAGDAGNDTLDGGEGADLLFGGDGDDAIDGGAGADYLSGGNGADELAGGEGADIVYGGSGDDLVQGDAGDDLLYGDAGKDVLVGGAGNDRLSGGLDEDAFVFAAGFGKDTVTDYKIGEDITFEDGLFADFADMLASSQQLGSDVKITVDAEHNLLLKNVALASLKADDFHFQA